MHRYRFLLFRPLQLLPVLLGISLITFMMVRAIPGDPARILLGVRSTPAALARIRAQFGLDEPLWATCCKGSWESRLCIEWIP